MNWGGRVLPNLSEELEHFFWTYIEDYLSSLSSRRSEDCWRLWLLRAGRRKMTTKARARFRVQGLGFRNVGIRIACSSVPHSPYITMLQDAHNPTEC